MSRWLAWLATTRKLRFGGMMALPGHLDVEDAAVERLLAERDEPRAPRRPPAAGTGMSASLRGPRPVTSSRDVRPPRSSRSCDRARSSPTVSISARSDSGGSVHAGLLERDRQLGEHQRVEAEVAPPAASAAVTLPRGFCADLGDRS